MRLLIDMNLSPQWATYLSVNGHSAMHWSSLGSATAPDPEIMAFAQAASMVILTHDLDFGAILAATGGTGPSVVQIRADDLSQDSIGTQVLAAMTLATDAIGAGALVTVDPRRARITVLPIGRR